MEFFEASHGKGAADGVGAVLKRSADRMVREGTDMPTADVVFEKLSSLSSIKLFFVSSEKVNSAIEKHENVNPPIVPGTMTLHQLIAMNTTPGQICFRDVSCFCGRGVLKYNCTCFYPKTFSFERGLLKNQIQTVVQLSNRFV